MSMFLFLACVPSPSVTDDTAGSTGSTDSDIVSLAAGGLDFPVDAAPSADGTMFYYLAAGASPGLFRVPADGSEAPELLDGTLRDPIGLVVGQDELSVYVSADSTASPGSRGIYEVHLDGSSTTELDGVVGLNPTGLADMVSLRRQSHNCDVFFAGRRSGTAGPAAEPGSVYAYPAGGVPVVLASGFDGGSPEALTAAPDRSLYVSVVESDGGGAIWHVPAAVVAAEGAEDPATAAVRVLDGYIPGDIPGIALTADASTLLISSLSSAGTSQVVLLDVATGTSSVFDDVINANTASGGVHRARDVNVFAWADSESGGGGAVYRVRL